ncbi:tetratricopeptide repeat-containing protein [Pedococcus soli]
MTIESLMADGNYLAAYDEARLLLNKGDSALRTRYLAVLALARSGALTQARSAAEDLLDVDVLAVPDRGLGLDIDALRARLAKDLAFESAGADRPELLADAARAYEAVHRRWDDAYPAANAATLWTLAGERPRAAELARSALPSVGEPWEDYWAAVTCAELALVIGDLDLAHRAVVAAAVMGPNDFASRAATRRQLARLCAHLGLEADLLAPLRNPAVAHATGHLPVAGDGRGRFPRAAEGPATAEVARVLEREGVRVAFGSLAAGADILVAEQLAARGGAYNVVLPFPEEAFVRASVAPFGQDWVERFRACLAAARSVTVVNDALHGEEDVLFRFGSRVAMGMARLRAQAMEAPAVQVAVWDGVAGETGVAADVADWEAVQGRSVVVDSGGTGEAVGREPPSGRREVRAMLFCDVAGFSGLPDEVIPLFMDVVMGGLGKVLEGFGDVVLARQTWGDAVHVVMRDTASAARCALRWQESVAETTAGSPLLASVSGLRISGHVGPVHPGRDRIRDEDAFFGAAVVRAARIEPRTPVGQTYVTEQFAALLALEAPELRCDYVGIAPTAKDYGALHLYHLRAAGAASPG